MEWLTIITWSAGSAFIFLMIGISLRLQRAVDASIGYEVPFDDNSTEYPPLSIIKPVYGADAHTRENFRSWAEQDYPAPLQLVFSFQRADDPGLPLAKAVTGPHEYDVIINPVDEGYSGKMSNLVHGLEVARHDFVVFSDSDIHADSDISRQLVTLHTQDVDLISCLMRHVGGGNMWGRIFAAFWNFEHMAFIAPAILKYGRDATGGTMAMTHNTLKEMGGLPAFKDYVAEDVAMGRKAHELGLTVGLGPVVDSPVDAMSFRALLDKFARAALFGSSMNNFGESVQYAILFSYWFFLLTGILLGNGPLLVVGSVTALIRLISASRFWKQTQGERRIFYEIFISDLVFLSAYTRALVTRRLVWGGIEYQVLPGGKMLEVKR